MCVCVQSKHETFAMAESLDSGKPLALARNVDIARSISNLRFFAQFAQHQQQGQLPHGLATHTVCRVLFFMNAFSNKRTAVPRYYLFISTDCSTHFPSHSLLYALSTLTSLSFCLQIFPNID